MWLTYDTTRALAQARSGHETLESHKANAATKAPADDSVGSLLETIAAVVPTGVIALYTGGALVLRQDASRRGSIEKAHLAAAMSANHDKPSAISAALANLPQESNHWLWIRWVVLIVAALVAVVIAFKAAKDGNALIKAAKKEERSFVAAEPFAALLAFVTWSLATPGTPLGAIYSPSDNAVLSAAIVAVGGLLLLGSGVISLSRPAKVKATTDE